MAGTLRWTPETGAYGIGDTGGDITIDGAARILRYNSTEVTYNPSSGGGNLAFDFSAPNHRVILNAGFHMIDPINMRIGQRGRITLFQVTSNPYDIVSKTAKWLFPGGKPTLSVGNNKIDMIKYEVHDAGGGFLIFCTWHPDLR